MAPVHVSPLHIAVAVEGDRSLEIPAVRAGRDQSAVIGALADYSPLSVRAVRDVHSGRMQGGQMSIRAE